jgi:cysteine sulfinate desulfinase/cysteine desulfurase-like protein
MGYDDAAARGGLRFSFGETTTRADVEFASAALERVCSRLSGAVGARR